VILRACHHARVRTFIVAAVMMAASNHFAVDLYKQLRATSGETGNEVRAALHGDVPKAPAGVVSEAALRTSVLLPKSADPNVKQIDFAKADAAAAQMNAWVANATRNNIRALIKPAALSKNTRGVLTAAIWLKAVCNRPFYRSARTSANVSTMQHTMWRWYAKVGDVQLLELPLVHDDLTMLIVLPDARNRIDAVESRLNAVLLIAPLRALGIRRLFDSRRRMFVGDFGAAARVTVNEEGTEASSAVLTATEIASTIAPPPPVPFIADHPFLYIIRSGEQVLFIGRVMDPRS
jgi:serine protease inhibitor